MSEDTTNSNDLHLSNAGEQPKEENENKIEMTTKEAYFASLNAWVKNANMSQNAMALFPWYLMSNYPQMFQNPVVPPNTILQPNVGANVNRAVAGRLGLAILDDQQQGEIINNGGGYEYVIAPFWKRALAEAIDIVLLLVVKIIVTFVLINVFDIELGFDVNGDVLRKALDDDISSFLAISMDFLAFSSDLLILEIVTKIVVCFNEALWTNMYNGATPGKAIMNLRILYVEAVLPLPPVQPAQIPFEPPARLQHRALLYPAENPSFKRALMRSTGKNLIITLLFPMCFLMIFFKNNRTVYDILTKTIVVEANTNPVYRRPRIALEPAFN